MSSKLGIKKKGSMFGAAFLSAPHDDLIIANLETFDVLDVTHLDLVPRHVVDAPGALVDEVVMGLDLRIEDDRVGVEVELAEEPSLDEEVQGVVDRGPGDHGEAGLDARPDLVGGGMLVGEEDVLGDDDALRGWLDAAGGEQFDDVSLHAGGILRLDLDDVKKWTPRGDLGG